MKTALITFALVSTLAFSGCVETSSESTTEVSISNPLLDGGSEAGTPVSEPATDDQTLIDFGDEFPKVLAAKATPTGDGNWRFDVTLSSAYDTPKRYADAWRVLDENDNQLGIRVLGHDHANEQPFTRSGNIQIPGDTRTVFIEGRDLLNGWSGQRLETQIPTHQKNAG